MILQLNDDNQLFLLANQKNGFINVIQSTRGEYFGFTHIWHMRIRVFSVYHRYNGMWIFNSYNTLVWNRQMAATIGVGGRGIISSA